MILRFYDLNFGAIKENLIKDSEVKIASGHAPQNPQIVEHPHP